MDGEARRLAQLIEGRTSLAVDRRVVTAEKSADRIQVAARSVSTLLIL